MDFSRGGFTGDLVICSVRANLDVFRPSNLSILTDVNSAEKRFICEWGEDSAPNVCGKVDDTLCAIWICDAKAKI